MNKSAWLANHLVVGEKASTKDEYRDVAVFIGMKIAPKKAFQAQNHRMKANESRPFVKKVLYHSELFSIYPSCP